jgi:hypothetical protein
MRPATAIAGGGFRLWPETARKAVAGAVTPHGLVKATSTAVDVHEKCGKGTTEMGKKYAIGEPDNVSGRPKSCMRPELGNASSCSVEFLNFCEIFQELRAAVSGEGW